jgi:DNA (cytosine-5)-methyltransferase 1
MSKLKIIDLFAGIGGIRLGFEKVSKQGVKCVFTSEWDNIATNIWKNRVYFFS